MCCLLAGAPFGYHVAHYIKSPTGVAMIRSMTSFARSESQGEWGSLQLELRSVNHRYLELNLRLPEELRALEPKIRERVNKHLGRGKVDCNVRFQPPAEQPGELTINEALVKKLAHASRELALRVEEEVR